MKKPRNRKIHQAETAQLEIKLNVPTDEAKILVAMLQMCRTMTIEMLADYGGAPGHAREVIEGAEDLRVLTKYIADLSIHDPIYSGDEDDD